MRIVLVITRACAELGEELERLPPRDRAEFVRNLAMQGLYRRREINAGLVAATAPVAPMPTAASEATPDPKLGRLKRKGLKSLDID
ncbi:hypothetical protein [Azospirillum sp. BE72]|uniref:hypothetical protein n=1 Tax=Azospirillum sp. BE72 TaxID=2817776 RepID=UPI00286297DB|nr:hypothetical protein [Azospirillum sp. BE72]MDR6775681.1 hypothetical protein [Azospirillum sp. BE72]